jgi:hypothetical protein
MPREYKRRTTKEEMLKVKEEIKKALRTGEYLFEKRGEISHFHHVLSNIKGMKVPHVICLGQLIKETKEELEKEMSEEKEQEEKELTQKRFEQKFKAVEAKQKKDIADEDVLQEDVDDKKEEVVNMEEETPNDRGTQYRFEVENIRRGLKEFPIALSETEPYLKVQKWQQAFYIQHVYHIPVHEYDPVNNLFLFKNTEKTREAHRKYHASDVKFLLAAFAVFRSQYYNPNYKR